jgi:hypothetical protein
VDPWFVLVTSHYAYQKANWLVPARAKASNTAGFIAVSLAAAMPAALAVEMQSQSPAKV